MSTEVAILLLLVLLLIPMIVWQIRSSREQAGNRTEPDEVDRIDAYDLHHPGGDIL